MLRPQQGGLSWYGIVRLGLVQTCLGAVVVLTTSTINRIMVVELALPAMIPGLLVGLHHAVQMSRPHFGYGSDVGGRTTGWIIAGMVILSLGGFAAACGTVWASTAVNAGIALCTAGFFLIGLGASAAGTSLLVTLAKYVAPERKPAAATIVWIMMIFGFAVTAGVAGHFLDPFSPSRLLLVSAVVSCMAVAVTLLAVFRLEPKSPSSANSFPRHAGAADFRRSLGEVWRETHARRFTLFVMVSMLAYSAQDLILEPYAGTVFGLTPGQSTQMAGVQHSGVLAGMIVVAVFSLFRSLATVVELRRWSVAGCFLSALALLAIAFGGQWPDSWPLHLNVFLLGLFNGAFVIAAIALMMTLADQGASRREGLRMGLWGAAQAIAFAVGGFLGTVAVDLSRLFISDVALAYGVVFSGEAGLFFLAVIFGMRVQASREAEGQATGPSFGQVAMVEMLDAR
ncbi:MAG: BCD family MFS transporter [Pseudomonadota bacterium]